MRKSIILVLILFLTFMTAGCSVKPSEDKLVPSNSNSEENPSSSYTELDKLPQDYPVELGQKNGDVINTNFQIYNIEKLDKFIESYVNKEDDIVRITNYTKEGDAIFKEISITNGVITLITDNTRDKFASTEDRKKREFKVTDIFKHIKAGGVSYIVKLNTGEEITLIDVKN